MRIISNQNSCLIVFFLCAALVAYANSTHKKTVYVMGPTTFEFVNFTDLEFEVTFHDTSKGKPDKPDILPASGRFIPSVQKHTQNLAKFAKGINSKDFNGYFYQVTLASDNIIDPDKGSSRYNNPYSISNLLLRKTYDASIGYGDEIELNKVHTDRDGYYENTSCYAGKKAALVQPPIKTMGQFGTLDKPELTILEVPNGNKIEVHVTLMCSLHKKVTEELLINFGILPYFRPKFLLVH